ncbi:unnamed protein product [Spirodela intermedia]|uniref:FAD-binding domain-containing protein n=1 Tax=Spirodela intermedia TaxID=51605 RepID=A0A7I8JC53_SPIIN|nr:unnamed protein product [Spirodela intermedia]CAA6667768.1 unnamed protein product [Spirodela intermedia]
MSVFSSEIVIAGGGICGLATALALRRKGVDSVVLERSSTLRADGGGIVIYSNGWRVLDQLGVGAELRCKSIIMPVKNEFRCLRRSDLVEALARGLPEECIRFGCQIVAVEEDGVTLFPIVHLQDGSTINAKVLIGCDGANSVVAKSLGMRQVKPSTLWTIRGFTDSPNGHRHGRAFVRLLGGDVTFGMMPIEDTFMHWFLSFRWVSEDSGRAEGVGDEAGGGLPPEASELVKESDLGSLILTQIKYRPPWELLLGTSRRGTMTIAGDALHVMGPFIGQGGSCGLEDAVVLARNLAGAVDEGQASDHPHRHGRLLPLQRRRIEVALDGYVRERKLRVLRLSTQTYLVGLMIYHPAKAVKLMVILVLLAFFGGTSLDHVAYDCGLL